MFNSIGVIGGLGRDGRVPLTPSSVQELIRSLEIEVYFTSGSSLAAGYSDLEYEAVGAQVVSKQEVIRSADLILTTNEMDFVSELRPHQYVVGVFNFLYHKERLVPFIDRELTVYSLDLLPRTTIAQSMDVLSSMASLAGYKAVIKAANLYPSAFPMLTTAAGTIKPAQVLVLGAGVAGLQAIATAKRLGARVEAFDVRSSAKEEVESLGAQFIEVEGYAESSAHGGYAMEQSEAYKAKQQLLIKSRVEKADIVISTANIPGKKAPVLMDKSSVESMHPGSVIVDLASEQGGNCTESVDNQTVHHFGVTIVGSSALASEMVHASSTLLSNNYTSFLKHLHKNIDNPLDPLLSESRMVDKGVCTRPTINTESKS
ncbi:MAG: NAD(P) transhydrogenase subunit alpha [Bacteroidetes bacterium]|nr:MAG: NAD(P) transhydrogenase subunit alpha [Bacteroidota bacterium]